MNVYTLTRQYKDYYAETDRLIEKYLREDKYKLKYVSDGWLKPQKQLNPSINHSKINNNLPRSRIRERKQIFLLKAA